MSGTEGLGLAEQYKDGLGEGGRLGGRSLFDDRQMGGRAVRPGDQFKNKGAVHRCRALLKDQGDPVVLAGEVGCTVGPGVEI